MRFLGLGQALEHGDLVADMARGILAALLQWPGIPVIIEAGGLPDGLKGGSGWHPEKCAYLIRLDPQRGAGWDTLAHEMSHVGPCEHVPFLAETRWSDHPDTVLEGALETVDLEQRAAIRAALRKLVGDQEIQADHFVGHLLSLLWDEGRRRGFYLNMGG